jgi:hypothetical protein
MKYWTITQVPNWLLASPVLLLSLQCCCRVYWSDPKACFALTLGPLRAGTLPTSGPNVDLKDDRTSLGRTVNRHKIVSHANLTQLLPHAHYTLAISTMLILSSHVQIALRLATAGAIPAVWWILSDYFLETDSLSSRKSPGSCGHRRRASLVLALVSSNVASVILYAGQYPPA